MPDAADKSMADIRAALAGGDCERARRLTQELRVTDPRGADAVEDEVDAALDERDFHRASEEATLTGMIRYLMKHPDGRHRAEAEQLLARLEGADDVPAPQLTPELPSTRPAAAQPPTCLAAAKAAGGGAQSEDALGDWDSESAGQIAADLERDGNPEGAAAELVHMRPQGQPGAETVREIERLRPAGDGGCPAEKHEDPDPSNAEQAVAADDKPVLQAAEPTENHQVPPQKPADSSSPAVAAELRRAGADERDRMPDDLQQVAVIGDSMLPVAKHGQRLLCSDDEPKDGDLAVIELDGGEMLFKRVRFESGRILCLSVNPDPQFMPFSVSKHQILRMRKVWGMRF